MVYDVKLWFRFLLMVMSYGYSSWFMIMAYFMVIVRSLVYHYLHFIVMVYGYGLMV